MNCDWTKENVVLYIYGELADDAKFEYEQHVRHCLGCRRELEQALEFKDAMAAAPVKDISPSFLAANECSCRKRWSTRSSRATFSARSSLTPRDGSTRSSWRRRMTAALLILGFVGGVGTTYKMMEDKKASITDNSSGRHD